ncbi:MAG: aminotransferase class III-fold pyridoxal phosphate-dependent enzyme [Vicinamibacterales bacterium]
MQRRVGFEFRGLLQDYLNDPVCDNYSVLIVLDADRDVPGARRPAAHAEEHPMAAITLTTEVPGPKSRALLARRAASVPTGLGKATDVVVERAEGALVHDVDGNTFLDFVGGIGALAVGHCPPAVVDAVQAQAAQLLHMGSLVGTYESYVRLCERYERDHAGLVRQEDALANTGAEAVENAVKAARAYTRRPGVICFEGGYHGRTLLTLSLTSKYSLFKKPWAFASEIVRLPMPSNLSPPPRRERRARPWTGGSSSSSRHSPPRSTLPKSRRSSSNRCRARVGSSPCRRASCSASASCATSTAS